jgi:hypothetical protein
VNEKKAGNHQGGNFFDSLMFGSPRMPVTTKQTKTEDTTETEQAEDTTQKMEQTEQTEKVAPAENTQAPQLDLAQMMQQFDQLIDYANKLGPSLKKMGPLFDLFKGFNGKK